MDDLINRFLNGPGWQIVSMIWLAAIFWEVRDGVEELRRLRRLVTGDMRVKITHLYPEDQER